MWISLIPEDEIKNELTIGADDGGKKSQIGNLLWYHDKNTVALSVLLL